MTRPAAPEALSRHPHVADWLRVRQDGIVEVRSGKVELGQGIETALAQVVANVLALSADRISVVPASTETSPDEGYTAGSASMEASGQALELAARTLRALLVAAAAERAGVPSSDLRLDATGIVRRSDGHRVARLEEIGPRIPMDAFVDRSLPITSEPSNPPEQLSRLDLLNKVLGRAAFVHDIQMPGMMYGRVLLPPTPASRLRELPLDAVDGIASLVATVRDGDVVGVVTTREIDAIRGLARLEAAARWEESRPDYASADPYAHLDDPTASVTVERSKVRDEVDWTLAASYRKPPQAHAAVAPSCAVARFDDDRLEVWTHSQGIFPLRRELARILELDEERIVVRHVDGPGCYGHNGADDAAGHAAVLARAAPGRPVRLQWTTEQEFGWEPYGPAMRVDLCAELDAEGDVVTWHHHVRTDVHAMRPDGSGRRLMIAWHKEGGIERDWPAPQEGGHRNAVPIYAFPSLLVDAGFAAGPMRTSALRTLGAFANVFAIESFVDEAAFASRRDPLSYRLAHLRDARAKAVLEAARALTNWHPSVAPSGHGRGVALARYKNVRAYVAVVADVDVDPTDGRIRVTRLSAACDAGRVVNRDGLRNQLQGGLLQGLSRTLIEEARQGPYGAPEGRRWGEYPVLGFRDVPKVTLELLDKPDLPPLGVGEAATTPVAAAIGNAVFDATGIRLRELPFTPERVQHRLLSMSNEEAASVVLGAE